MGSPDEEELVQMVRDFLESEPPTSSGPSHLNHDPLYHKLQEILGKQTDEEARIHEKILKYSKHMKTSGDDKTNNFKKLLVMKLKKDGYAASLCRTSWDFTSTRHKVSQFRGDYEYIDVMLVDNNSRQKTRVIVDIDFLSQFEVARPSTCYRNLLGSLPSIFVGTEEKLEKVIPLLCSAAKKSLRKNGFHIPPWRKASFMQSKWFSKNLKRVSLAPTDIDSYEENKTSTLFDATKFCCEPQNPISHG